MIRDANGVPVAAVIRKRIVPQPDNDDIAFGLQHLEHASQEDEMIKRALIIDHDTFDQNATDKDLEKTGTLTCATWLLAVLSGPSSRDALDPKTGSISSSSISTRPLMDAVLTLQLKRSCLEMTTLPPSSAPLKKD